MTRIGKIARLPKDVREELNRRLQDGEAGPGLLEWLNKLPECKKVLAEEFGSQPISKQNLSQWKTGGYEEWLRKEESRQQVQMLVEKAEELEEEAGGMAIADRLGTVLAVELAVAMEQLKSIEDPKERWARLKDIARELYRLRREDHHGRKLEMAEERWEIQSERDEEEYFERRQEAKAKQEIDMFKSIHNRRALAESLGGGEYGDKWAEWMINTKHGLPMHKWEKKYYPKGAANGMENGGSKMEDGKGQISPQAKGQGPKSEAGQGKSKRVKVKSEKGTESGVQSPQSVNKSPAPQSTVEGEPAGKKNKDGDRRDACPTADGSAQVNPSGSKQIKPEVSDENGGLKMEDGETNGTNEGRDAPRGGA